MTSPDPQRSEIPLRNSRGDVIAVALVDPEDFDRINLRKWHKNNHGYAVSRDGDKRIRMHNAVMGVLIVDHINGNKLDNRRSNLRKVSNMQNSWNQKIRSTNTSGYKGVSFNRQVRKYVATIRAGTVDKVYLGLYEDPQEAAYMYDQFAMQLMGEYARTNYDYSN